MYIDVDGCECVDGCGFIWMDAWMWMFYYYLCSSELLKFAEMLIHFRFGKFITLHSYIFSKGHAGFFIFFVTNTMLFTN